MVAVSKASREPSLPRSRRRQRSFANILLSIALIFSFVLLHHQYKKSNCKNTVSASESARMSASECHDIIQQLKETDDPFEINIQRRYLALLDDPWCYKKHIAFFVESFQERIEVPNRFHFLIPETVAQDDLLCHVWGPDPNNQVLEEDELPRVKRRKWARGPITPQRKPCRFQSLCQFWTDACDNVPNKEASSCLNLKSHAFVTNERYLDHAPFCPDRLYSISVREATTRAILHVDAFLREPGRLPTSRGPRLNILQSNFQTWSLVSASTNDRPMNYQVSHKDVALAKQMLSRFDIVMDLKSSPCLEQSLHYIKSPNQAKIDMSLIQTSGKNEDAELYHVDLYGQMNAVDRELYRYAQDVMRVDCEFFNQVEETR